MKNLPAIFTLTVSALIAGMVQVGRPAVILAGPAANASSPSRSSTSQPSPSFYGIDQRLGPVPAVRIARLSSAIDEPAAPESARPGDPANPRAGTEIAVTHDRTTRNLNNPLWWAVGALVLVAIIAIIAMSTRGSSGTTVVRG